jgi:hypothetical protein
MRRIKRVTASILLLLILFPIFAMAQTGPTFFYVVTAVDSTGMESLFSNEVKVTFTQGKHIVSLTWIGNAAGYNVYRATTTGGPYTKINTVLVAAVTYSDIFVLPNAPSGLAATQQ